MTDFRFHINKMVKYNVQRWDPIHCPALVNNVLLSWKPEKEARFVFFSQTHFHTVFDNLINLCMSTYILSPKLKRNDLCLSVFSSSELAQDELLGYRDVRRTCGSP